MKRLLLPALVCLGLAAAPAAAWPTVYPTGTTVYTPQQAQNSYTLFNPLDIHPRGKSTVYLINMRGDVVHRWRLLFPALFVRLLPNGNLLILGANPKNVPGRPGLGHFWIGGMAGTIEEMTWGGKVVFRHDDLNMHHDVAKLPNGHYLYLAWEKVPSSLQAKIRGGLKGTEFPGGVMFNDYLVEVDARGRTVWTWHANAHLDPDLDIIGPVYKRQEWCHDDGVGVLASGNLVLTSRQTDSVMIVEKPTGRVVWRWGNATYLDKTTGHLEYRSNPNVLGGPHNFVEIPRGYPGAGHLLGLDNGLYYDGSRAVEVNPGTSQLLWQSGQSQFTRRQFSWFLGNAQRLANGNTFICEGANGRFSQQTARHELVWEFVNPFSSSPLLGSAVLKAFQYAPDYCEQFKQLPPAQGAAIIPPSNELLRVQPEQPTAGPSRNARQPSPAPLLQLPLALAAVCGLILLLVILSLRRRPAAP